ncbi:hypothetical protein G5714_004233 [Onychostoma macrolepis]|uniref:MULE transposase domain-containing protein n=1 Tax=Onychostoma macrolepis TaxID=369639 RepID=A0A7J6D460_9TELE|nr:hypothetical protein G5714_004233 [Onychostoma macrolepis]
MSKMMERKSSSSALRSGYTEHAEQSIDQLEEELEVGGVQVGQRVVEPLGALAGGELSLLFGAAVEGECVECEPRSSTKCRRWFWGTRNKIVSTCYQELCAVKVAADEESEKACFRVYDGQESADILAICLEKLAIHNPGFLPRSIMIDRDLKELNAIRRVFPTAKVLLCWFHVLQAVHRWMVRKDGGNLPVNQRNTVIQTMASMKSCLTEEEFNNTSARKCEELDTCLGSSHVSTYLKNQWICLGELWSNFGRSFYHHNSETNNKAERFFLTMKYQFLKGKMNSRIDQLLRLLCGDVQKYYSYLDDLTETG